MTNFEIVKGYLPGLIGRVAELHATYYQHHWGFGLFFEAKVATELAAFLGRYDEQRDGFLTVLVGGRIEGSITIEGLNAARHLYEKCGFRLVEQQKGTQWGREVNEERFELRLR